MGRETGRLAFARVELRGAKTRRIVGPVVFRLTSGCISPSVSVSYMSAAHATDWDPRRRCERGDNGRCRYPPTADPTRGRRRGGAAGVARERDALGVQAAGSDTVR